MNLLVEIASLDEVPLREVWPDEARDFTPWLAANQTSSAKRSRWILSSKVQSLLLGRSPQMWFYGMQTPANVSS